MAFCHTTLVFCVPQSFAVYKVLFMLKIPQSILYTFSILFGQNANCDTPTLTIKIVLVIAFTPVEVVDFILKSVNDVSKLYFDKELSEKMSIC